MSGPRYDCQDCSTSMQATLSDPEAALGIVGRSAWSHARTKNHTVDITVDDSDR